jgi:hypothetical protein
MGDGFRRLTRAFEIAAENVAQGKAPEPAVQVRKLRQSLRAERRVAVAAEKSRHVGMRVPHQNQGATRRRSRPASAAHAHTPQTYTAISAI